MLYQWLHTSAYLKSCLFTDIHRMLFVINSKHLYTSHRNTINLFLLLNVYAVAHSASLLRTSILQRSVDKEIPDKLLSHFAPFRSLCLQLQKEEIFYVNSLNAISSLLLWLKRVQKIHYTIPKIFRCSITFLIHQSILLSIRGFYGSSTNNTHKCNKQFNVDNYNTEGNHWWN